MTLSPQARLVGCALWSGHPTAPGIGAVSIAEIQDRMEAIRFKHALPESLAALPVVTIAAALNDLQKLGHATARRHGMWSSGMNTFDSGSAIKSLRKRTAAEIVAEMGPLIERLAGLQRELVEVAG